MSTETDRDTKLAKSHWDYIEGLLYAHGVESSQIEAAQYTYLTAFAHGYKHAFEDMQQAAKAVEKPAEPETFADLLNHGFFRKFEEPNAEKDNDDDELPVIRDFKCAPECCENLCKNSSHLKSE